MKNYCVLIVGLLLSFQALAQEETFLDQEIELGWFKTEAYTYNFAKGDTMVLSFTEITGLPITSVWVINEKTGKELLCYVAPSHIPRKIFAVQTTADYTFFFQNTGPLKRKAQVKIARLPEIPPIVYRDTIVIDTIETVRQVKTTVYDTIPEEIIMAELAVPAAYNINAPNRMSLELPVPQLDDNYFWIYWIGISQEAQIAFEELEAAPHLKWEREGVSLALIAYARGLIGELPYANTQDDLTFYLMNETQKDAFEAGIAEEGFALNSIYGAIQGEPSLSLPLYLCVKNNNDVSPVNLYIKAMGFLIQSRLEVKEIARTEITERLIKVIVEP